MTNYSCKTGNDGVCNISDVLDGEYILTASKEGYKSKSEDITIFDSNINFNIVLNPLNKNIILTTDICNYIQLYLNYINFVDENNGITIDWGDGTVETVQKSNIISHNYSDGGRYVIILHNVESLDNYAFQDSERIYKVEIPDNCELGYSIVDSSSIDEIHIPRTVTISNEVGDGYSVISSPIKYLDLNWTTPPINYEELVEAYYDLIDVISIPPNTFQSYADEGYPIWKLIGLEDQFECRICDINNTMSNLKTVEYLFEGTFNIVKYDEYIDEANNLNIMKISLNDNDNVFNNNIFLLPMDSLTNEFIYVPLYDSINNYNNQNPSYYISIKEWYQISNFHCIEYNPNTGEETEYDNPDTNISIEINEYTYEGSISEFPRYFKLYPSSSFDVNMTTEEGYNGGGSDFNPSNHDFYIDLYKYNY